ncbi:M20/M25/M40 family metallo-hydrolase [Aerococcus viridans]|uniref:M20/M25/M40 family metallo-hydrolase n=1 Tax=Aerococcus urinaeequi TaxID=51665 RepID=UPI003AAC377F
MADYLADLFAKYDIETQQVEYNEGRSNLIADMGKTKVKKSVVSGHLDIVEAGDEYEWKFRPFSGEITGDKRYDRGTSDMKSGLFGLVIIMCELKEEGADLNSSARIFDAVGEEIGRIGSKRMVKQGYIDGIDG